MHFGPDPCKTAVRAPLREWASACVGFLTQLPVAWCCGPRREAQRSTACGREIQNENRSGPHLSRSVPGRLSRTPGSAAYLDGSCVQSDLTSIMAAKPFSWRVVGITKAALTRFSELDFRYRSGTGLTRAHLSPRIATVRSLLTPPEPLNESDFLNVWIQNDRTVLCGQGENKVSIPTFIEFENANGELFYLISWHGLASWST